jgi:CBS domain-containing protein
MKEYKVRNLMVPAKDYVSVSENATLFEAVKALNASRNNYPDDRYPHRGILVYNKNKKVIGKLGHLDILRALEPRYFEMQDRKELRTLGFSIQFMKSMLETYRFLDGAMKNICKKAGETKVSEFVEAPTDSEFVDQEDSLDSAIHQLVLGQHQSLLVTSKAREIVGILRLTDVFSIICQSMYECGIE